MSGIDKSGIVKLRCTVGVSTIAKGAFLDGKLVPATFQNGPSSVFPAFDPAVHQIDCKLFPPSWKRFWTVQFGCVAPTAILTFAVDPSGRLYCYRQMIHTRRMPEDHARQAVELHHQEAALLAKTFGGTKEEMERRIRPDRAFANGDEFAIYNEFFRYFSRDEQSEHLHRRGPEWEFYLYDPDTGSGVDALNARLALQRDGKPRLFISRDSVVEKDAQIQERGMAIGLAEELPLWIWRDGTPAHDTNNSVVATLRLMTWLEYKG